MRTIVIIAVMGYGIGEVCLRQHRYSAGITLAGIGAYALVRDWQRRKNPALARQQPSLFNLAFWAAIVLFGVLLWWAVRAR